LAERVARRDSEKKVCAFDANNYELFLRRTARVSDAYAQAYHAENPIVPPQYLGFNAFGFGRGQANRNIHGGIYHDY
jgi:hypothetical protein